MKNIIYWKNPTNKRVLKLRIKKSTITSPACKGCYFDNEKNIESEVCSSRNFYVLNYPDCDSNHNIFELIEVVKDDKHFKKYPILLKKYPILHKMNSIQDSKPRKGKDVLVYTIRSGFNIASLDGKNWRRKPSAKSHLCVSDSDRWIELEKLNVINS